MNLSGVVIVTAVAVFSAACAESPTSPESASAGWTLTLDESSAVTSITVTCHPDARLHICHATANIANGPPRDITQTTAVWKSSDITIATVSPFGVVTHLFPGETVITAAAGGLSGSTTVVVN
jgi:hypothetical protein